MSAHPASRALVLRMVGVLAAVLVTGGFASSASVVPSITKIAPLSGPMGATIRLTGVGFTGATGVSFNGVAATWFRVVSDTRVKVRVPDAATTGPVTITTESGNATSAASFVVTTPIEHVVIIFQENHSFDNVLGAFCVVNNRCDGAESGQLLNGSVIPLGDTPDIVPLVNHSLSAHREGIDHGKMDGFDRIKGCGEASGYACYSQYAPSQIPNLAALAGAFAVSDRTFEDGSSSFGAHIGIVSPTPDGFSDQPQPGQVPPLPGGGCPSDLDAPWYASGATKAVLEPACIPDYRLDPQQYPYGGAYRSTPVPWVPTIMDEMTSAGVSWRIYGNVTNPSGWSICPTFADCIYTSEASNLVPSMQILTDAGSGGTLPQFSIVTPPSEDSQHNQDSMTLGDDWIGQVVQAIENGPDWDSTAIFITYDDFGGFYDHVPPPAGGVSIFGIRVPMVIVSPYAKAGYTDSRIAGFPSLMAFAEHVFGLAPLGPQDAEAYDFGSSFDFTQVPLAPIHMVDRPISKAERRELALHPADPNDPS